MISIGQFARLLLTVVMVAVSQAPSPESNPNSPLPVTGKVVNYTTFNLIGGKFIQHRPKGAFATFACLNNVNCPKALVFVAANCTPHHTNWWKPVDVETVRGWSYRY